MKKTKVLLIYPYFYTGVVKDQIFPPLGISILSAVLKYKHALFNFHLFVVVPVFLPDWLWFLHRVQFYDQLFPDIFRYAFPFRQ